MCVCVSCQLSAIVFIRSDVTWHCSLVCPDMEREEGMVTRLPNEAVQAESIHFLNDEQNHSLPLFMLTWIQICH